MQMNRDSFIFYRSFYEALQSLPDNQRLCIYDAVCDYSLNFTEPDLTGICKSIFTLIKPQLDANNQRYKNGSKGGRPTKDKNQSITEIKPKHNQSITKPKANKNVNVNVNKNVNVNGIVIIEKIPLLEKWLNYRTEIKKPIKVESTLEALIEKFNSEPIEKIIYTVNTSIENNWQGLFWDKYEKTKQNSNGQTSTADALSKLING